jgi:hypothetical protein
MDVEQLGLIIAADFGGEIEDETGKVLRGESTRAVELSELYGAAALIAQCAQRLRPDVFA